MATPPLRRRTESRLQAGSPLPPVLTSGFSQADRRPRGGTGASSSPPTRWWRRASARSSTRTTADPGVAPPGASAPRDPSAPSGPGPGSGGVPAGGGGRRDNRAGAAGHRLSATCSLDSRLGLGRSPARLPACPSVPSLPSRRSRRARPVRAIIPRNDARPCRCPEPPRDD